MSVHVASWHWMPCHSSERYTHWTSSDRVEILLMDGQRTILSEYPNRKNNVESSIEPRTAKSYFSMSGRFFHSGSHIIIFSKSIKNHFHRLREVFSRLKAAGLKLKPAKCHLLHRSVKYLGHIVSADGVMASYYRRFVKNFAQVAAPLHQLTQKDKKWNWNDECEHAFHHLKHLLTNCSSPGVPTV